MKRSSRHAGNRRAGRAALVMLASAAAIVAVPRVAPAQQDAHATHATHPTPPSSTPLDAAAFMERARGAGDRYRDHANAVADGFRPLGPDFPGMAQHWISVSRLMRGGFDAALPHVLTYAEVDGEQVLLGAAWTVLLAPGQVPPPAPAGAGWHEHAGTIDEESAMLHQLASGARQQGSRIAMLHAWLWLENPDGPFASDNWSVPFRRARLAAPRTARPDAARALSLLATDGVSYWLDVARVRAGAAPDELPGVRMALERARAQVSATVRTVTGGEPGERDLVALAAVWTRAWRDAAAAVAPARREAVRKIADVGQR